MENKSRGINVRCLWVKYKRTNPEEKMTNVGTSHNTNPEVPAEILFHQRATTTSNNKKQIPEWSAKNI